MIERRSSRSKRKWIIAFLWLQSDLINTIHASPTTDTSATKRAFVIDLSYQHHKTPDQIRKSLLERTTVTAHSNSNSNSNSKFVDIDISSCLLGDEGLKNVLDAIISIPSSSPPEDVTDCTHDSAASERTMAVSIRMNRLSPIGVSFLFDRMDEMGNWNYQMQQPSKDEDEDEKEEEKEEKEELLVSDGENSTTASQGNVTEIQAAAKLAQTNKNFTKSEMEVDESKVLPSFSSYVESLDISFNDIGLHGGEIYAGVGCTVEQAESRQRTFLKSLQQLVENKSGYSCPTVLRMDNCGLGPPSCRSIGKGIVNCANFALGFAKDTNDEQNGRTTSNNDSQNQLYPKRRLKALHLSGNDAIGDAGTTALAAALRTASRVPRSNTSLQDDDNIIKDHDKEKIMFEPVLDTLDLSSCGIGDAGAEALAMAIQGNPGCFRKIDLSNNKITDDGAVALGNALKLSSRGGRSKQLQQSYQYDINLSNNHDIGDRGAAALAEAMKYGSITCLSLRSCSVGADGSSALGNAFVAAIAAKHKYNQQHQGINSKFTTDRINQGEKLELDISGNKLGILQSKKKSGAKYSASLLKSKASATTASYMNFIGNKLKSGLKEAGLDVTEIMGALSPTSESDDDVEEEERIRMTAATGRSLDSLVDAHSNGISSASTGSRCGARSFADSVIDFFEKEQGEEYLNLKDGGNGNGNGNGHGTSSTFRIGMRMCSLEGTAADALAATILFMEKQFGVDLSIDAAMNVGLEEGTISALKKDTFSGSVLEDMAKRYMDALEAIKLAQKRAADLAEAVSSRDRDESVMDGMFSDDYDGDNGLSDFGFFPGAYDSDEENNRYSYDAYDEYGY